VYPATAYLVTRRCTQRTFLLRPDAETNNAFIYCLAVAAERHEIDVIDFVAMSNHLHDAIFDRTGNAPAFYEHFHKLLAKCMNALRGRWENFFSSEQTSVVRLETPEDVIERLVYIATNPVKDDLVETIQEWPGASGHHALVSGRVLRATRPKHFFSDDGDMPAEVTLRLRIPPELGDEQVILRTVAERVRAFEVEQAKRRVQRGIRVMGRYAVLRQSWRESPTTREPRRGLNPTVAARHLWLRLEALQRKREFTAAYRFARAALLAGNPVTFPAGTYWLRLHMRVEVEALEKLV